MNPRSNAAGRHLFPVTASIVFGLLLTACRGAATPPASKQAATQAPASTATAPSPSQTPILPTPSPTATPLPQIEAPIVWCLSGSAPKDLAQVEAALNQALDARAFRARLSLRVIDPAGYMNQVEAMRESDAKCDLYSLSGSRYPGEVEQGLLLALTAYTNPLTGQTENLLEERFSRLWNSLPLGGWAALRDGGEIYAVPHEDAWVLPRGVSIRADVVRALSLEPGLNNLHAFDDLTPLFARIQAAIQEGGLAEKGIAEGSQARAVLAGDGLLRPESAGFIPLAAPFVARFDDPEIQPFNWYETDDYRRLAELRFKWQEAGFAPDSPHTPDQVIEGYRAGKYLVEVGGRVWPGSALEQADRFGFTWVDFALSPAFLSPEAVRSSLTGVSAHIAGDPERVLRTVLLLEWVHTDAGLYNLLVFGIEGRHWSWQDEEKRVIALAPGAKYSPDYASQIGSRCLSYALTVEWAEAWARTCEMNAVSPAPASAGFHFDPRPVAAEASAVRGMLPELENALLHGQARDVEKEIQRIHKALDGLGLEAYHAELLHQVEEWKAAYRE